MILRFCKEDDEHCNLFQNPGTNMTMYYWRTYFSDEIDNTYWTPNTDIVIPEELI